MSRFYFHFASKADKINDDKGVDMEGPHAAHRHALDLIRKTALSIVGEPWRDWVIEITNADGQSVLTVPFHPNIAPRDVFKNRSHDGFSREKKERLTGGPAKMPGGK